MKRNFLTLDDVDVAGKRVLIREDFNVPLSNGKISNSERIDRALPTIRRVLAAGAQVILMSHFGRPKPGTADSANSLSCVQIALAERLGEPVQLIADPWAEALPREPRVLLLENTRFWVGELENDPALSQKLAGLADVFVMDAFATAHRSHASTVGVAQAASIACAGPLLCEELDALEHALTKPKRPVVAIVGGAKVSTKIQLIDSLLSSVDHLIVGGGIANTFLLAQGHEIGHSLAQLDCVSYAKEALQKARERGVDVVLPSDVVVAHGIDQPQTARICALDAAQADDAIFDVGPKTEAVYKALLQKVSTILWNGPVGVFEIEEFAAGTSALASAVAASPAYSLAGGGDTLAAIEKFGISSEISYISTGGGAFLAWCEGGVLPAVAALMSKQ